MKKKLLTFIGGMAAATLAEKVLKTEAVHKSTVKVMAGAINLKEDLVKSYENLKEDAQDLAYEAKKKAQEDAEAKFKIEECKCEE